MVDTPAEPLKQQLALLPRQPGVYLMQDAAGRILYVGKAVDLRQRVRSYFQSGSQHPPRTQALVAEIASLEVIVTDSEAEALILENTLVKKHWPEYNIKLKDGREYPYLKITWTEPFPRLFVARKRRAD